MGRNAPLHSHFIPTCAMNFKVKDLRLEIICRDHFKEDEEGT